MFNSSSTISQKNVNLNLSHDQGSILVQLRCDTLPFKIETGRFMGTPKERRYCDICSSGQVEDEFHFVFYYSNERNEFDDTIKLNFTTP